MPNQTTCVKCCGEEVEIKPDEDQDWLGGLCKYTGVGMKIPRGVWFQKPLTDILDFIKKINGQIPEDTLDWEVDEEKVKKYEKQFGPEGMLFSAADFISDTIRDMGITREQWKERFKQKLPNNEMFYPDPILLLGVARDFCHRYPNAVVIHHPSGKKIVFGKEQLQRLKELDDLLNAKKITKADYDLKTREVFSTGREDPKGKLRDQLKELKANFDEGLIPEDIYKSKVAEILSKTG